MFIEIDDSIINVHSIVRIYELIPNQVWISLSNGDTFLVPNFDTKKALMSYIVLQTQMIDSELERMLAEDEND